jgi:hypothetical protein
MWELERERIAAKFAQFDILGGDGLPDDIKGLRRVLKQTHPDAGDTPDRELFQKAKEKLDRVRSRTTGK